MSEKKHGISLNPRPSTIKKLEEFADLYRGGPDKVRGNAARCYMHLHPRCKSTGAADVKGAEYLAHPIVQDRLREKTDAVAKNADITQERVLKEVARLAMFDFRKLFNDNGAPLPINELEDDIAAAIVGIDVVTIGNSDVGIGEIRKYKLANKSDALEKLMRHLGLYEKDNDQRNNSLAEALIEGIKRVKELK